MFITYTYVYKEIYYKILAQVVMETEKSKFCSQQARDPQGAMVYF